MPRYHFHVRDGVDRPDREGTELPGILAARAEALMLAGWIIMDAGARAEGVSFRPAMADPHGLNMPMEAQNGRPGRLKWKWKSERRAVGTACDEGRCLKPMLAVLGPLGTSSTKLPALIATGSDRSISAGYSWIPPLTKPEPFSVRGGTAGSSAGGDR